ncbi:hypothetical protein [Spirosoma endbachense]|uniref:Uncharacterized protein n=1 Tax=Spirosoma endbachense TaxID=2666025 RepID=A0A6P1VXP5_9BACT|nr:hypothetical protein [Spirosoma endbachense]QHV96567.1 hypothetical protein GJR95_16785 [Spirosoma endbachense]
MESSNQWIDITRFGQKIIHELELNKESSILGLWMAQRVAELIRRVETTKDEAEREALAKECTELILKLWEKRNTWPSGGPLADIYPTLKRLFGPRNQYYSIFRNKNVGDTGLISKLAALHQREMKLFINSPNVATSPEIVKASNEKLELYIDHLSKEESQALLFTAGRLFEVENSEKDPGLAEEMNQLLAKTQDTFTLIEQERLALIQEASGKTLS